MTRRHSYTRSVSTAEHPEGSAVRVLPPEEALRSARPLSSVDLVVEDVSAEDWAKLREALTEA